MPSVCSVFGGEEGQSGQIGLLGQEIYGPNPSHFIPHVSPKPASLGTTCLVPGIYCLHRDRGQWLREPVEWNTRQQ